MAASIGIEEEQRQSAHGPRELINEATTTYRDRLYV